MKHFKSTIIKIASATVPTRYGNFKTIIYQDQDKLEHTVLIGGKIASDPTLFSTIVKNNVVVERLRRSTLVRIHSQCLTGDVFSSLKCDCREQLDIGLKTLSKQGGILIYLSQEGRGIGLSSKIKAYSLQEKGYDTVEANHKLGFAADLRSYKVAAQILKSLNVDQIMLMTNNPDKVSQLRNYGITVTGCIPLEITPNRLNKNYLKTKKNKLGHKLSLV